MSENFNLDVSDAIYKYTIYSILYFYQLIFLHTNHYVKFGTNLTHPKS